MRFILIFSCFVLLLLPGFSQAENGVDQKFAQSLLLAMTPAPTPPMEKTPAPGEVPGRSMEIAGIVVTSIGIATTIAALGIFFAAGSEDKDLISGFMLASLGYCFLVPGLVEIIVGGVLWGVGRKRRLEYLRSRRVTTAILPTVDPVSKKLTGGSMALSFSF